MYFLKRDFFLSFFCYAKIYFFYFFYIMSMFVSINDYRLNKSLSNVHGAGLEPSPSCLVFCIQVLT